jgi:hypothetical protein
MNKLRLRRGMVLLQTLVISIILSMIAVMVLKWVLGRYMLAARNYRSSVAKVKTSGYSQAQFSAWNMLPIPTNGSSLITEPLTGFQQRVCYCTCPGPAGTPKRVVVTSGEDDPTEPCPSCPGSLCN